MKLYVDTSVFGALFDEENKEETSLFFNYVNKRKICIQYSQVTENEISKAPGHVRGFFHSLENIEFVKITKDMEKLARKYIESGVLRERDINDAEHIACATLSDAYAIVSWNFRHIVNMDKIAIFNSINLREGYKMINIYPPTIVYE